MYHSAATANIFIADNMFI